MPAGKINPSQPFPPTEQSIALVNQEFEKVHQKAATLYFNGHRATHIGNSFRLVGGLLFVYGLLKEEPMLFPIAGASYYMGYTLRNWGINAQVCAEGNPFAIPYLPKT